MQQTTDTILMIRPVKFRMNEQTAVNNYYQENIDLKNSFINIKAQQEFDDYVKKLEAIGVNVIVVDDRLETDTPDSIFPNNWVSFHADGTVAVYPMFAENRRLEKREDVFDILENKGFIINGIMDYSSAEEEDIFLEGTGSIILDRANKKAYCALSPRADEELFIEYCEDFDYFPVIFTTPLNVWTSKRSVSSFRVARFRTWSSRVSTRMWAYLSILYVCPARAFPLASRTTRSSPRTNSASVWLSAATSFVRA